MMTERRYGFRFNGVEGSLLIGSVFLASFLIFVSGVYVGRELAGRKVATHTPIVRAPVVFPPDPIVARTTSPNDSSAMRTTSVTNVPMISPGAKEKAIPPAPSIAKPDTTQLVEKEKLGPASVAANIPSTGMPPRRAAPSLSIGEENLSPRMKPQGEPFTPKSSTALASRNEKRAAEMVSRNDNGEKKSATVTVARVEKVEPLGRAQGLPLEGREREPKQALVVKKPTKQDAGWRVQVGATTYEETAQDMARELRDLGYSPFVSKVQMNGETLYRVRIGKFTKQGEAVAAVGRFRREGRFSQAYLVSE